MSMRHIPLLLLSLLALPVRAEEACAAPEQCNQMGTAAYKAGRFAEAIESFERQLRRVERDDEHGFEQALNNLILANLRAGDAGMARAWLQLALDGQLSGPATRHNLIKVVQALNYQMLGDRLEGIYLRYSGQAMWSELHIREIAGGYQAIFLPLRAGARVEEYGPAAIGELAGTLQGDEWQMRLQDTGLQAGCAVSLLHEGIRLQVLEVFADGCQEYGGMGISVAGQYIKIANRVSP